MKNNQKAIFVISLDFELYWGVLDKRSLEAYQQNLLGVQKVIPKLLKLFKHYDIHATWAIVGLLFAKNQQDALHYLPTNLPNYVDSQLSPFSYLLNDANVTQHPKYYFAQQLIQLIQTYPHQEIGSHTFSHYYCLEKGQDKQSFEADLRAAIQIAQAQNFVLKSLIFPRNQLNDSYLEACEKLGFQAYRGNPTSYWYAARSKEQESLFRRAGRLLDAYINISGHNCYDLISLQNNLLTNIPASRFLRPYSPKLKFLEKWRLNRIKNDMLYAAKHKKMYHLWWHPHNFGSHMSENFHFLAQILDHYQSLRKKYDMESLTMEEIAERFH